LRAFLGGARQLDRLSLGSLKSRSHCLAQPNTTIYPPTLLVLVVSACATTSPDTTPDASAPDAGPDAGPFAPQKLTGLALWLDANQGVISTSASVVKWQDQSGNSNDAVSGPNQPLVITGLVNNLPAIRFDGQLTYMQMPDAADLRWGTGDYVVAIVAAYRNPSSMTGQPDYAMLYGKSLQTYPYAGTDLFVNWPNPMSTKAAAQADANHNAIGMTTGLNDNRFHVFAMRHKGTTLEIRVDGHLDGMTDVTGLNADATGAQPTIGGQAKIVQMLDGDIAEVLAVKGSVSDGDMAALEAWLKRKYAL